jgi:ribose/xylose/arabinose/galactoside ABC-type transport system permease subunit
MRGAVTVVAAMTVFGLSGENLLSPTMLRAIVNQIWCALVIAAGLTLIMLAGGFKDKAVKNTVEKTLEMMIGNGFKE